jgi:autotransporter-associated beta strand protein
MKNMKSTMVRMTAVMLCVVYGIVRSSFAVDRTWTGAVNSDWRVVENWLDGVPNGGTWEGVIFDSNTVRGGIDVNMAWYGVGKITLASGLTNNITMNNGGAALLRAMYINQGTSIASDSADLTINADIWMWGQEIWDVGAGRTMTINGQFTYNNGAFAVIKDGAGTAVIGKPTGYPGPFTVKAGTLRTSAVNALGAVKMTVESAGTWVLAPETPHTVSGLSGVGTVTTADAFYTGQDGAATISSSKNYVHKLDFGNGPGATVNGVVFDGVETTSGTGWSLSGAEWTYWADSGSGYSQLLSDFRFDGNRDEIPTCLTFSNLVVGTKYEVVIFADPVNWGSRSQDIVFSNGVARQVLRSSDPWNWGYCAYRFTASTDSVSITMNMVGAGSFHWYGATLEDMSGVAPGTRTATLMVGAANTNDFNGVISGDVTLVKQGSGKQYLGGANTYSGATIISNGTLYARGAVPLVNAGFESPDAGPWYLYMTGFPGGNNDGIPGGWSSTVPDRVGVCKWVFNPAAAPEGVQCAFLQGGGTPRGFLEQVINIPADGTYELVFQGGGRNYGAADLSVLIDGVTKASWPSSAFSITEWAAYATPLTLTAGPHTLRFENTSAHDGSTTIDEVKLFTSTGSLPTNTTLSLAGGVLDLGGVTQTVASVASAAGVMTSGTLNVTSALYPGGVDTVGTLTVDNLSLVSGASLYWDYEVGGADTVSVTGTATLPANATVRVHATAALPERVTLFQCGSINAPSDVSGWTVVGGRANTRVVTQGNLVQLVSPKGTLMRIY